MTRKYNRQTPYGEGERKVFEHLVKRVRERAGQPDENEHLKFTQKELREALDLTASTVSNIIKKHPDIFRKMQGVYTAESAPIFELINRRALWAVHSKINGPRTFGLALGEVEVVIGDTMVPPVPAYVEDTRPVPVKKQSLRKNSRTLTQLLQSAVDLLDEALELAREMDTRNADIEAGIALISESLRSKGDK